MARKTFVDYEKSKKKKFVSEIVPNGDTILRVYPPLAAEIGLNESILLLQFEFWLGITKEDKKHMHDGRKWVWKSVRDIQSCLMCWSRGTVNNVLRNLVKQGLLIKADKNYNQAAYDRTDWFAMDWTNIWKLKSMQNGGVQSLDRGVQELDTIKQ